MSLSTEPPVVSAQLFHYIDHGRIRIYPEVKHLEGADVAFTSGVRAPVDTIVWATGFNVAFPFLGADRLPWRHGIPLRVAAGMLPPTLANLYFIGLVTPGGGNFPVHHAQGQLLAEMIKAQRSSPEPLATSVFANEPPTERMYSPVAHLLAQTSAARRAVAKRSNHRRSLPQLVGTRNVREA
jgi:hypothetical protein